MLCAAASPAVAVVKFGKEGEKGLKGLLGFEDFKEGGSYLLLFRRPWRAFCP
jgi:hypothetical protein